MAEWSSSAINERSAVDGSTSGRDPVGRPTSSASAARDLVTGLECSVGRPNATVIAFASCSAFAAESCPRRARHVERIGEQVRFVPERLPSWRQISPICQRGEVSPGYHLPGCVEPARLSRTRSRSAAARLLANSRFRGPSAATVHSVPWARRGRRRSARCPWSTPRRRLPERTSTSAPSRCSWSICAGVYGLLTRGSLAPVAPCWQVQRHHTGLGGPGSGRRGRVGSCGEGMWPSPANSAEVGSRPIHPAPGM